MQTPTAGRRTARRLAAALIALSATALAGCGFNTQTNEVYQPAVGANARQGTVDVLAAVIVSSKVGRGVFLATLVDTSDNRSDRLTSVTASDGVQVASGSPTPDLPAQTPVDLATSGGIAMTGDGINAVKSSYVEVTLSFASSDAVTIDVPVVNADGPYAQFGTPSAPNSVASQGADGVAGSSTGGNP